MADTYKKRAFYIGDLIRIEAWDCGRTWNGFAVPYLAVDAAADFIPRFNVVMEGEDLEERYEIRDESIVQIVGKDAYTIMSQTIQTLDGPVAVFDVGFGCCWETSDPSDHDMIDSQTR